LREEEEELDGGKGVGFVGSRVEKREWERGERGEEKREGIERGELTGLFERG